MKIFTTNPTRFSARCALFLCAMLMAASMAAPIAVAYVSPAPVDLGTAGNFAVLAKTGISTTGTTSVVGDIGVSPAAASYITGFALLAPPTTFTTSALVTGKVYASDFDPPTPTVMGVARGDMETAFTTANGIAPDATELGDGNIGGMTLAPGVYKWGTGVTIPTNVILSGNASDVWIFQIAQTLDISSGVQVLLSGGALAKNIFWVVAGQTTLGTTSVFNGNILDQTAIVLSTGATLNGRALAQTAVTLDANAVTKPLPAATHLAFGVQPGNTNAGQTIAPAVTVRILDANDNLVTDDTRDVTLAIATNPGSGTLSGTKTVAASSGVATFSSLSINTSGTGYTLSASSSPLTGATSGTFNLNAGGATKLAFGVQPGNTIAGGTIMPYVTVRILDANDTLVTTDTRNVTLAIAANPGSGILSGLTTVAAQGGVAMFSSISINKAGAGYTLSASSSPVLTGATSSTFNVTVGAATKVLVETAADGSGTGVPAQNITAGSSITVYAIIRDASNNFVGNVAADSLVLANVTGGVVSGDLVQSGDKKSAVFTGHAPGTAEIKATSGTLAAINSGTITVSSLQPPSNLIVSDIPNDQGHYLKLTWTASPSETGGNVSYYRIYRSLTSTTLSDSVKSMNQFTDIRDVTAWEQHATVLVDSVAAGTTEYTDSVYLLGVPYYYWMQAVGAGGASPKIAASYRLTVVENELAPSEFSLSQNFPNPFNPSTTIQYSLAKEGMVSLKVYNVVGQEVATLVNGSQEVGRHTVTFNADKGITSLSNGVYFYRLEAGSSVSMKKLVFMK